MSQPLSEQQEELGLNDRATLCWIEPKQPDKTPFEEELEYLSAYQRCLRTMREEREE